MGGRRLRRGPAPRRTRPAERRLLRVPLVPRDGARVLRGRPHGRVPQLPLRERQGRPRGASRRRRRLHGGRAGGDRAGRLAHDGVPHPGCRALLLRHLLPARAPARHAVLPPGAPGRRAGLGRAPGRGHRGRGEDRAGPRRAGDLLRRRAATRGDGARTGAARADPGVRPAARRVRRGAEVPAVHGGRVPAAPPRPHRRRRRPGDGARHLRADGARQDLRPAGRRLRPLLRRPRVGGAPLREDALRQRPAVPRLRPSLAGHGQRAGPPRRPGDRRLHGA